MPSYKEIAEVSRALASAEVSLDRWGMKYDMTIAPFNYTKAKGRWKFDGQISYFIPTVIYTDKNVPANQPTNIKVHKVE